MTEPLEPVENELEPLEPAEPEEPEIEPSEEPEEPTDKGETRYQRLANERREAKESAERERLGREAAEREREYYRNLAMQAHPKETEFTDPDEQWRKTVENQVNMALFQANETADRAAYLSKLSNPLYSKYQERVEQAVQEARRQGNFTASREGVLALLVGQDALKNTGKTTPTKKAATQRVDQARGEPTGIKPSAPNRKSDEFSIADFESQFGGVRI